MSGVYSPRHLEYRASDLNQITAIYLRGSGEAFPVEPCAVRGTQVLDPQSAVAPVHACVDARGVGVVDPDSAAGRPAYGDLFRKLVGPTPLSFGFGNSQNQTRPPARTTLLSRHRACVGQNSGRPSYLGRPDLHPDRSDHAKEEQPDEDDKEHAESPGQVGVVENCQIEHGRLRGLEDNRRRSYLYLVSVCEQLLFDPDAVHPGPVGRTEVYDDNV
jgi:hypothetical protein